MPRKGKLMGKIVRMERQRVYVGSDALWCCADDISCTRHDDPGNNHNKRIMETLAYACGLLSDEQEARRMLRCLRSLHDHEGHLTVWWRKGLTDHHRAILKQAWEDWGNEYGIDFQISWRDLGCSDCGKDFAKNAPFVHHETDGSLGGPWCIECAFTKYGFGGPDPNRNFVIHEED
jgi:hypothetical protein